MRDVAYNPTGTHIASAAIDGEVKLWSATNGSQVGSEAWEMTGMSNGPSEICGIKSERCHYFGHFNWQ